MIRVMIVDDHPAMRAGLTTVLEQEEDIVPVGAAPGVFEAQVLHREARPDVVMLDFHLPGQSSLGLVRHLKSLALAPRVIVYSAHTGPALELGAALAGADAVISKETDARRMMAGIRAVHEGTAEPLVTPDLLRSLADTLPAEHHATAAMLLHGSSEDEIAATKQVDPKTVKREMERMLALLEPEPISA